MAVGLVKDQRHIRNIDPNFKSAQQRLLKMATVILWIAKEDEKNKNSSEESDHRNLSPEKQLFRDSDLLETMLEDYFIDEESQGSQKGVGAFKCRNKRRKIRRLKNQNIEVALVHQLKLNLIIQIEEMKLLNRLKHLEIEVLNKEIDHLKKEIAEMAVRLPKDQRDIRNIDPNFNSKQLRLLKKHFNFMGFKEEKENSSEESEDMDDFSPEKQFSLGF